MIETSTVGDYTKMIGKILAIVLSDRRAKLVDDTGISHKSVVSILKEKLCIKNIGKSASAAEPNGKKCVDIAPLEPRNK